MEIAVGVRPLDPSSLPPSCRETLDERVVEQEVHALNALNALGANARRARVIHPLSAIAYVALMMTIGFAVTYVWLAPEAAEAAFTTESRRPSVRVEREPKAIHATNATSPDPRPRRAAPGRAAQRMRM